MQTLPEALVVSDFPIIGHTAKTVLRDRFHVTTQTWHGLLDQTTPGMSLVIIDVTATDRETALALIAHIFPASRVAVCSLHQNEVEVYRVGLSGAEREAAYTSLLQFAA